MSTEFTQQIASIRSRYDRRESLKKEIQELNVSIDKDNEEFQAQLEALSYIGAISESNTNAILDYITGVINNFLAKAFPYDTQYIRLERSLYRDTYSHINLELVSNGESRDIAVQSGDGLKEMISLLFTMALIEVRKERRILIMDEALAGLHKAAKDMMKDIIQMFADSGFQFVIVEYGMNDIGKIYLLEKKGESATATEFQGTYTDDIVFMEDPEEEENGSIEESN